MKNNDEVLDRPPNYWDRCYERVLTSEETKEIQINLGGFFELLNKWQNELTQPDQSEIILTNNNNREK